jgi:AcrR family transcriptional regulator
LTEPLGLRGRKKQQTRALIAATAWRLFEAHGFEAVTVGAIAREANVAEKTVFNYFPTKEDLFYSSLESFEQDLLMALRERPAGETVLRAFRTFLLDGSRAGLLAVRGTAAAEARRRLRHRNRMIAESPALQARERQIMSQTTRALADLIAAETRAPAGDISAMVVATALVGVHAALIEFVRRRTLAEQDEFRLARDLRAQARRAFDLLESGLRHYAAAGSRSRPKSRR